MSKSPVSDNTMNHASPLQVNGALVLITGGASGVGLEVAKLFSKLGAQLHLVGRTESKLQQAIEQLAKENPNPSAAKVTYSCGDVSDASFCRSAFKRAHSVHNQRVKILINNAGTIFRASAANTSDDDWQRVMNTNVNGVFFFSREFALQDIAPAAIVNVSSTCGQVGAAGLAAYCASKGAVDQLTRSMALELAPRGITVNAVAPGAINSPMLYSKHEQGADMRAVVESNNDSIPQGRIAEPQEVARSILFLATEPHITGTILSVDGGYTAL